MSDSSLSIGNSGIPAQAGATTGTPPEGPPDLREQGVLFRSLLEAPHTARQWAEFSTYRNLEDRSNDQGADTGGLLQTQISQDTGQNFQPAATAAGAGAPDPAIAELIERHIRRALASVDTAGPEGEMRIELSDAVFPGAALTLKRMTDGWQLSATADNRQSLDELNQVAPDLVERFAKASLGHLRITLGSQEPV